MNYVAYTANQDGSINILAGSTNPAVFDKILPTGTIYEVHEGETYSAGGKTYLSDTDPAYLEAKAKEEKEKALADLDNQYDKDKAEIIKYYNEAIFAEDTEMMAELKEEMAEIDAKYKADRKAIEEGSEE
jgi:hypothetical protein